MLDTVKINHVQHISFTQSRLTDAVSVILNGLLSYEHPPKHRGRFVPCRDDPCRIFGRIMLIVDDVRKKLAKKFLQFMKNIFA